MASPMRKKRAWSTREDDAESKETAAFEASVAAAQDTAAKSGAFLSSAKEDLTDHNRWLRAQSAAVERDRQRHERWLQRQRDHRLALAKKERVRRRRQLLRQQAMLATRQAIAAGLLFIRSWIVFAFGRIGAGLQSLAAAIARGFVYVGRQIAQGFVFGGQQIATGARWAGATLGMAASQTGRGVSAGSSFVASKTGQWSSAAGRSLGAGLSAAGTKGSMVAGATGRSLGAGLSAAGAKGSVLADATGRSASSGFSHLAAKASMLGAASKRGLANGYHWTRTRAAAAPPAVYTGMAKFGRQAEHFARTRSAGAERVHRPAAEAPTLPAASVHVIEVYGPHREGAALFGRAANDPWTPERAEARRAPEVYGPYYEEFWIDGASPNDPRADATEPRAVASRADAESALSSWLDGAGARAGAAGAQARVIGARAKTWAESCIERAQSWAQSQDWAQDFVQKRGYERSQMMIVAGAVLLVCGGLLIGGGLLMRAGAGPAAVADIAPEETFSGITWTFNEPDLPLPERAVFTLSGTPESFGINGLSVTGVNNSDQPLTGLAGVLKPDVQRPDLKLLLQVDKPKTQTGETESQAMAVVPKDTVPAHGSFHLVFPFPAEAMGGEDGITVDEFFDSYGGLLLKLRYEVEGAEKSVIQYLSPDLLKGQIDEVSAEAGGS